MGGSGSMVVGGLAALAVAGVGTAAATSLACRQRPYLPRAHAGRCDVRRDPLATALRHGCAGLTVAVAVGADGRLLLANSGSASLAPDAGSVAGPPPGPGTTLESMVIRPLAARVEAQGRVYPAQIEPFAVVVEPLEPIDRATVETLHATLCRYDGVLSHCRGGTVTVGAVTLLISGARQVLAGLDDRYLFADGTLHDLERAVPTALVPLVSEHIAWRLGWDGTGVIPPEERHLLRALVHAAHAEGKRVRFFGVPERPRTVRQAYWRELHAAGADLIGARRLGSLRRFLRGQHSHRSAPVARRYVAAPW